MPNVPFVRYGGNFVVQQAQVFGLALDGDRDRLQALCDKTLNLSPTTRCTGVPSTVLVAFMRMDRLCSGVPASAACGTFTERELNISILLAAEEKVGPLWLPSRLVWPMPYLWLDSSNALIAGRDSYGFPKQFGSIAMPIDGRTRVAFVLGYPVEHSLSPAMHHAAFRAAGLNAAQPVLAGYFP